MFIGNLEYRNLYVCVNVCIYTCVCVYSASNPCSLYCLWGHSWVIVLRVAAFCDHCKADYAKCLWVGLYLLTLLLLSIIMIVYEFFLHLKYWISSKYESWVHFHNFLLLVTVFSQYLSNCHLKLTGSVPLWCSCASKENPINSLLLRQGWSQLNKINNMIKETGENFKYSHQIYSFLHEREQAQRKYHFSHLLHIF